MSTTPLLNIFWFRRDLRLHNNTGLYHALKAGLPVQCVFIFDMEILHQLEDKTDKRVAFIHRKLLELNKELKKYGQTLITEFDTPVNAWNKWVSEFSIKGVYMNNDYEPYARSRDELVADLLLGYGIPLHTYKDHVIFEKNEIAKDDAKPYTVFTPYKNRYLKTLTQENYKSYPSEKLLHVLHQNKNGKFYSLEELGFIPVKFQIPTYRLTSGMLKNYAVLRDYPALDGTSKLSIHLRFGTISIRELVTRAVEENSNKWLNELIWRDFYQMILWHFPKVSSSAFKPIYNNIHWRNNVSEFEKWCEGSTGYPIVDAGMRELNATGFMHNRVRMITASFLVKHLLIDWRWGEAYFASKLLDFDLASNNGGWQWAAGSGCDAAPYFRIFNPEEQTRKFDREFNYIRKWVPEFEDPDYPPPIIDHKFARERCLRVFSESLKSRE